MIPHYDKIHNRFRFNGFHYNREELSRLAYGFIKEGEPFEKSMGHFLLDWVDEKDSIMVKTSGSTGTPKNIQIKKQAMVHSAIATGDYFKLKPGDTALHCLSTDFIAGKMMLVRALILGFELDVVEPSSKPYIKSDKKHDFCAMVPMQVENSINQLKQIKKLIIGGTSVPESLVEKLQNVKTNVYATYGMTETITHIAVKQLNHLDGVTLCATERSLLQVLPSIAISQDKRDCLVIEAPQLFEGKVITNDIVKLHSDSAFEFLGRYDNVINSGGVKLFPEQIEAKLSMVIEQRFFIASEADETLGEKLVMVIEGENNKLIKSVFSDLGKFEKPKEIYSIPKFLETASGKMDRKKTMKLIK